MSSGWKTRSLGELIQINHGYAFKGEYFSEGGDIVVLTPGNFYEEGGFKSKGDSEKTYEGPIPENYILEPGDLIVAMTEQAQGLLGSAAFVPAGKTYLHNQRLGLVEAKNDDKVDLRFIYYLLNSSDVRAQISATASGVKVRHTSPSRMYEVEASVPPLPVQRRIAEILGAYDDLIENNRRRIEILEEMASRIFREWFVHYRYPGHEDDARHDSDLGEIPADWEVVTVPEAIEVNPRVSIPDGEKHYVPMASVRENSMVITCDEMRDQRRGRKFQNGDTLFARITPSLENGKTGFVQFLPSDDDVGIGSGELINLRSKTLCPEFVYQLSRTHRFRQNAIKSMTGGSGRQRVQLECFDDFKFAHPPQAFIEQFQETVRPMFSSVQNLVDRNRVLRETRDLLLPRLVSGEIEVGEVEGV